MPASHSGRLHAHRKRAGKPHGSSNLPVGSMKQDEDDWELTPARRKELDRRLADLRDRTRWLIVDPCFGAGWRLIYDVGDDSYLMHRTRGRGKRELLTARVTVFKREALARDFLAILKKRRKHSKGLALLECRVSKDGSRVTRLGKPVRRRP